MSSSSITIQQLGGVSVAMIVFTVFGLISGIANSSFMIGNNDSSNETDEETNLILSIVTISLSCLAILFMLIIIIMINN